jgi:hypothetical protein
MARKNQRVRYDYDIYFYRSDARLIEQAARGCGVSPRAFLYNIILNNAAYIVKHGHICGKKLSFKRHF